uniref:Uncharacterized protein n=1 Tax=Siphoviridae sp. ctD2Q91 TaxID=2825383 RepID=A0A8S5PN44_9CAUD|nr:MAG TPA: hypothetical protein [Siphoviridae sp. ctD2Q91]
MKYDKNSFLAGISVGRTLKGWAAGSDGFSGGGGGGGLEIIPVKSLLVPYVPICVVDAPSIIFVTSYSEG